MWCESLTTKAPNNIQTCFNHSCQLLLSIVNREQVGLGCTQSYIVWQTDSAQEGVGEGTKELLGRLSSIQTKYDWLINSAATETLEHREHFNTDHTVGFDGSNFVRTNNFQVGNFVLDSTFVQVVQTTDLFRVCRNN